MPLEEPRPVLVTLLLERTVPSPEETTETPALLRSWLEELRVALELLPLWVAELLAELPERTALELLEELPLRVVVPLLRVELLLEELLEELPLRVLVLPLWLLRVLELLPLWLEEELPLRTLLEELLELLPLLRVLPLWLEELPLLTLLELEELLPLLRVLPLWALELPLLRVLPLWLLRVEDEEVLADCLLELLLRVALLEEVLPEERVEEEEDVVERLLLPELRLCAIASAPSRSIKAAAPAAVS